MGRSMKFGHFLRIFLAKNETVWHLLVDWKKSKENFKFIFYNFYIYWKVNVLDGLYHLREHMFFFHNFKVYYNIDFFVQT